jgi:hypothetical protein
VPKECVDVTRFLRETQLTTGFSTAVLNTDCAILQAEINKHLLLLDGNIEKDQCGNYWELGDEIKLPFACRPVLCDKLGNAMTNYIVDRNAFGNTWGYFWLIGEHVGPKPFGSQRIEGAQPVFPSVPPARDNNIKVGCASFTPLGGKRQNFAKDGNNKSNRLLKKRSRFPYADSGLEEQQKKKCRV